MTEDRKVEVFRGVIFSSRNLFAELYFGVFFHSADV